MLPSAATQSHSLSHMKPHWPEILQAPGKHFYHRNSQNSLVYKMWKKKNISRILLTSNLKLHFYNINNWGNWEVIEKKKDAKSIFLSNGGKISLFIIFCQVTKQIPHIYCSEPSNHGTISLMEAWDGKTGRYRK